MPDLIRTYELKHCQVVDYGSYVETHFKDPRAIVSAWAHDTPSYRKLATLLGYGDDIHRYCLEHEVAHSFTYEVLFDRVSPVLWCLAQKRAAPQTTAMEEAIAIAFQGFCRAGWDMWARQPGIDWPKERTRFITLMGDM